MADRTPAMPYEGLRVLDISQGIAGPYCAQIMWQQGADVIKVEPPSGDWGRAVGVVRGDHSALSLQFNVGKRALALDTRMDAGRRVLFELASRADVVIQNFRPGVVERMGVSYGDIVTRNPNVVYVSISGYGPSGPSADAPATDSVMQADSGLMFSNQDEHGHPRRLGVLLSDIGTGLYAAQSLATALYHRLAHKEGSHIQISLFESSVALQGMSFLEQAMAGARSFGAVSAPNGVFHTADGRLTIVVLNNDQFARLCRALDRAPWLEDPRFADSATRMRHKDFLHAEISAQLHRHSSDYWMQRLSQHDVLHA
ncbi:MAG: CoA transferase [Burkholderiaceae bacterium]|nr:CoA transferase [Burkholderiaceae bacterium]